ncbi:hypothetical protein JAAARDRAFT_210856 [Jaapia argillacea MUCL 33604]|uniref:HMG box domain-containing protein n=1 Tax=Jaapia argillacea MUCL 33604 TaxID=933084 RepID=A0A067PAV4_9AGAM|nr:hypothetical protein JAAARDRAFT_210856 [Jaapia argillacea MUCL 33604]
MLSLLAQRLSLSFPVATTARRTLFIASTKPPAALLSFQARRTFITTPSLSAAAAAAAKKKTASPKKPTKATATKAKKATAPAPKAKTATTKKPAPKRKLAAKKPVKTKAKANPGPKPKPKKKVVVKPKRMVIAKEDLPPKKPPGAYMLFGNRYRQGLDADTLKDVTKVSKGMAEAWHALSEADKKVYHDENVILRGEYLKARQAYFERIDPTIIQELNKRRKAKGQRRVINPIKNSRPLTSYIRYIADFRATGEARAIRDTSGGREMNVKLARAAGASWAAMSDAEKAPYVEAYHKELDAWKAGRSTPSS